jgi:GNAT superfamily N-acetyltransferase
MTVVISIANVNSDTLDDFLDYFDKYAFADNPGWQTCYCYYFYADHTAKEWEDRTAQENRAASIRNIAVGDMRGYLAYVDGKPAAWCNATPRRLIPALRDEPDAQDPLVGSILCFVVAKPYRQHGIASRLLSAACDGFRSQGMRIAEGYPFKSFRSEASSHFGPLAMYLDAGFSQYREDPNGQIVVRKELA